MTRGVFITLEGGEGVGKSTLSKALTQALTARGRRVVETREPGGTPGAEALRRLILAPPEDVDWSPAAQALLFNAARKDHLDHLINPALAKGDWVVCDRFSDSTRVYQTAAGGVSQEALLTLEGFTLGSTSPDLTVVLDIDVAVAAQRRTARGGDSDPFEAQGAAFHQNVRDGFLDLARAEPGRCAVIDADQPIDKVLEDTLSVIDARGLLEPKP